MPTSNTNFYTPAVNLGQVNFTNEEIKVLELGPNYALEQQVKYYVKELIIETNLDMKLDNTHRFLAYNKIKQILNGDRTHTIHKRQLYIIKQICKELTRLNASTS
jgi:hypothetical protein